MVDFAEEATIKTFEEGLEARGKVSEAETSNAAKCFLAPCGARIVVREDRFEYKGKLVIPDTSQIRPTTGRVVALGPDVSDRFAEGDRLLFANFSGTLCQFEQQPAFRILNEEEILAKITTEEILDYTAT
jgi:co-chaperonin GroES (HSP10)